MKQEPLSNILIKPVSADCNLACEYCFYSSKSALYPQTKRHRMSDDVLRELVEQLAVLSLDRVSFVWQGGEPTLAGLDFYKKVVKYQSMFRLPGQLTENSLQTNGILIDDEWARFLAQHRFLVGVSLDGPPELHDYHRKDRSGDSSHEKVMKGIEWLKRYNVDFNILVLLNKRNVEHPKELYRYFLEQGFKYLQFIPCVERDLKGGDAAKYSITPEQYGRFLCAAFDEWTRNGVPDVYVRTFDETLITYVTGTNLSCTFSRECGKYVVVEHNGDVYPCDFFVEPRWLLGNLTEHTLEEIVREKKFVEFTKRKSKFALNCEGCPWLGYCNGGCPKHWVELGLEHNYFCSSYKTFFSHSHQKFLELKEYVEKKKRSET